MGSRGVFIVLEGIDGSGKTTQVRRLAERLRAAGRVVVETREPTDGSWGRRYRAWARGEIEAGAEEVLGWFAADRLEHVERVIAPALARGEVVICDRYVASTRAYQVADGVDPDKVERSLGEVQLPEPDLTLWLRIPVSLALERMGDAAAERYERAGFLERVDAVYAGLGLETVDASGDLDAVTERLWRRIQDAPIPLA